MMQTVVTGQTEFESLESPQAVGARLLGARQALGWSVDEAAARMRIPAHVVGSLEAGNWQSLGAPVFVRGQLRSYSRLLGLDSVILLGQAPVEQWVPVSLVSHASGPRLRRWMGVGRSALLVVSIGAAVVLAAFALRGQWSTIVPVASLDELPVAPVMEAGPGSVEPPVEGVSEVALVPLQQEGGGSSAVVLADAAPVEAVVAASQVPAAMDHALQLQFAGDSWVEISGHDGRLLEKGLVAAGQLRSFPAADVGKVVLGNAAQVSARLNGQEIDLSSVRRSNVARFTVSSDGSVLPSKS